MSILLKYRILLAGFVIGLVLSGLTAFPLTWELSMLTSFMGVPSGASPGDYSGLTRWLVIIREGLVFNDRHYPFLAYGTDWLAFAHLMIALAYWGPLKDPVRNRWVLEWGMLCCLLTWPLILICGPIRGIPIYWQLIDATFGALAIGPLYLCRRWSIEMEWDQSRRGACQKFSHEADG